MGDEAASWGAKLEENCEARVRQAGDACLARKPSRRFDEEWRTLMSDGIELRIPVALTAARILRTGKPVVNEAQAHELATRLHAILAECRRRLR
jgi:hypothetical protein